MKKPYHLLNLRTRNQRRISFLELDSKTTATTDVVKNQNSNHSDIPILAQSEK